MKTEWKDTLLEGLEILIDSTPESVSPKEIQSRISSLEARSSRKIDVIWEKETFDGSFHYDLLLPHPEGGTVSMSYCPDRGLPWPMRGVHRWSDGDLLRVNNILLKVEEAMGFIDFVWKEASLLRELVNTCIVREYFEKFGIEPGDREVQDALDALRRSYGLFTKEQTEAWMAENGLSYEWLGQYAVGRAMRLDLRARVTAGRVEAYFEQNRNDFETVCVARIDAREREDVEEIAVRIREEGIDFFQAASNSFVARSQDEGVEQSVLLEVLRRHNCEAPQLFEAVPGAAVGPVKTKKGWSLFRVLSTRPAVLDTSTSSEVQDVIFEEWLAMRRSEANIEWFWGQVQDTESWGESDAHSCREKC